MSTTNKNPLDELEVELGPSPAERAARELAAVVRDQVKALPRYMRRDFTVEYSLMDKALTTGLVTLACPTRSAAQAQRQRFYHARMAQREVFKNTEDEKKYEDLYFSVEHKPEILLRISRLVFKEL